jgi:hypothetical protein
MIMKTFSEFSNDSDRADYSWCTFEVDDLCVHVLIAKEDATLQEGRHRGLPIGGQYTANLHSAHTSPGMKHIHVYAGNNQIFAMNSDGTAHDQSHGAKIPSKVAKAISQRFPDFKLPPNNVVEGAPSSIMDLFRSELLLG